MQKESDWPLHIQQRYGVDRRQKLPIFLAAVLAAVVALGLAMANYRQANPSLDWKLISFNIENDKKVSVSWTVARSSDKDTYCVLRAQDGKRMDVGYATVLIPAGQADVDITYRLSTESLAVLAEVLGCGYQPEMRVPPANFPPGVKIPAQEPPGLAPNPN